MRESAAAPEWFGSADLNPPLPGRLADRRLPPQRGVFSALNDHDLFVFAPSAGTMQMNSTTDGHAARLGGDTWRAKARQDLVSIEDEEGVAI